MRAAVYAEIRRKNTDPVTGINADSINDYIAKWDAFFVNAARWNFQGFKKIKIVEHWTATTLYEDFEVGDTYAELTTNANIPNSGRMSINRDEVDYTAKDTPTSGKSVTISTATDALTQDVDHDDGEIVEFLTPVPSDFGKPGEIWLMNVSGNSGGSKMKHVDWRDRYWPLTGTYTHKEGYLYLPANTPSVQMQLNYWKKGMKLTSDSESLQTPEKWDNFVRWASAAQAHMTLGQTKQANDLFSAAGVSIYGEVLNSGLLNLAIGEDSSQSDSLDEVFEAGTVNLDASFSSL
mgnify:CR=1 FL=1